MQFNFAYCLSLYGIQSQLIFVLSNVIWWIISIKFNFALPVICFRCYRFSDRVNNHPGDLRILPRIEDTYYQRKLRTRFLLCMSWLNMLLWSWLYIEHSGFPAQVFRATSNPCECFRVRSGIRSIHNKKKAFSEAVEINYVTQLSA